MQRLKKSPHGFEQKITLIKLKWKKTKIYLTKNGQDKFTCKKELYDLLAECDFTNL